MDKLKKYTVLIFRQIKNHPFSNLIFMAQIILVLFIAVSSETYYSKITKSDEFLDKMTGRNIYYAAPRVDYGPLNDIISETEASVMSQMDFSGISTEEDFMKRAAPFYQKIYELNSSKCEEIFNDIPGYEKTYEYTAQNSVFIDNCNLNFIDEETADILNYSMKSGSWITDLTDDDDVLKVVATSPTSYRTGDEVTVCYYSKTGKKTEKKAVVAGVTKETGYFTMIKSVGGSYVAGMEDNANALFYDSEQLNDNVFFCLKSSAEKYLPDVTDVYNSHRLIKLSDNISDEEIIKAEEYLQKNYIFYISIDKLSENYHDVCRREQLSEYAFIGCLFFIVILGMSGFVILNTIRNQKLYSVYYLSGMKWRDIAVLNLLHCGLICLTSYVAETIIYIVCGIRKKTSYIDSVFYKSISEKFHGKIRIVDFIDADLKMVPFILGFFLLLCIVSAAISVGIIRTNTPNLTAENE